MTGKKNIFHSSIFRWTTIGIGTMVAARALYKRLNRYNLDNKVVLITGASRGLGLVLARQLAAKGARLAICARTIEQLGNAHLELERMGADVLSLKVDVTDRDQVKQMIHDVIMHYGKLDVLINNAGIIQVGPQDAITVEEYEEAMNTHFWSALYTMLESIPHFKNKGQGRIINITSIGGKIAVPHLLPYTASKFALVGLSEGMHAELKKHNILVTTVVPNLMRTGSPRNIIVKGDHAAEYAWFKISDSIPLISQKAETAAKKIISAIEYGETEIILTLSAKVVHALHGLAPGLVSDIMAFVNKLLPENIVSGKERKRGYESESALSQSFITSLTNKAAVKNNQITSPG